MLIAELASDSMQPAGGATEVRVNESEVPEQDVMDSGVVNPESS